MADTTGKDRFTAEPSSTSSHSTDMDPFIGGRQMISASQNLIQ